MWKVVLHFALLTDELTVCKVRITPFLNLVVYIRTKQTKQQCPESFVCQVCQGEAVRSEEANTLLCSANLTAVVSSFWLTKKLFFKSSASSDENKDKSH